MSTQIAITYQNKEYKLEYSRQSVRQIENAGFVLDEIGTKPVNMIPLLFYGAFLKNHTGIKRKLVDEIFDKIPNKLDEENGIVPKLIEMYSETVNTLSTGDSVDEGNAVAWTVVKG